MSIENLRLLKNKKIYLVDSICRTNRQYDGAVGFNLANYIFVSLFTHTMGLNKRNYISMGSAIPANVSILSNSRHPHNCISTIAQNRNTSENRFRIEMLSAGGGVTLSSIDNERYYKLKTSDWYMTCEV